MCRAEVNMKAPKGPRAVKVSVRFAGNEHMKPARGSDSTNV
jgi:hypothetical protein